MIDQKVLEINQLQMGMQIHRFLDVPLRFQVADPVVIAFLRKFKFTDIQLRRAGRVLRRAAGDLQPGDQILELGTLTEPVKVLMPNQIQILNNAGFYWVLAGQVVAAKVANSNSATALMGTERPRLGLIKPAESSGNNRLILSAPKPNKHMVSVRDRLRTLQDQLPSVEQVLSEGDQILNDIYDTRFHQRSAAKKVSELSKEMVGLVERSPYATSVNHLLRDSQTTIDRHSLDVANYLIVACKVMQGFDSKQLAAVGVGGLLHDIGKTQLPEHLLVEKGRYNQQERILMARHPQLGAQHLAKMGYGPLQVNMALHHHVNRQGGYPEADYSQISPLAKLTGIADIYQAMTAYRSYKKEEIPFQAMQDLLKLSRIHVDVNMVMMFIKAIGVYPVGSAVKLSDGNVAFVVDKNANTTRPKVVPVLTGAQQKISNPTLMDLDSQDFGDISIDHAVNHREYFPTGGLDLFANLDFAV